MRAESPVQLIVYSRRGCQLCDELVASLRPLQIRFDFELTVLDVDRDPMLCSRYGEDVPVLVHGGRELCRHRLDHATVTAYLMRMG